MARSQTTGEPAPMAEYSPWRRQHPLFKRIAFRLVAVGLGGVVALLAVEIGLRVLGWVSPGFYQNGEGPLSIRTLNAEGGFGREFAGPVRHRSFDFDVPMYINKDGFRERELVAKAEGEWRIGLFADSFGTGHGVRKEQGFGEVWFDAVRSKLPDASLWNFASGGAGAWQMAAFLDSAAKAYELDEVILALFAGNELQDNANWAALRELSSAELRRHDTSPRFSHLRTWLRKNSRLGIFVWSNIRSLIHANRAWYSDSGESLAARWVHTDRALGAFKRAVGDRPLTIWYLPSHAEWDNKVWQSIKDRHALQDTDRFAVRKRIKEWAEAQDVPFVDCTPLFKGKSTEDLKFNLDPHWNANGHKLVGEGLAAIPRSGYHLRRSLDD